jgi:hypothetical protein
MGMHLWSSSLDPAITDEIVSVLSLVNSPERPDFMLLISTTNIRLD